MLKIVIRDLEDTKRLAKIVSEGIEDRLILFLTLFNLLNLYLYTNYYNIIFTSIFQQLKV